jgi:hypothetical protein
MVGEDVEDHRRAVDDRQPERLLQVAFLSRGQLVVAGDEVGVRRLELVFELLDLARAEVRVRVRRVAALNGAPDGGGAGGAQQLFELGQLFVLAGGQRGDHERALTGTAGRALTVWPARGPAGVRGGGRRSQAPSMVAARSPRGVSPAAG